MAITGTKWCDFVVWLGEKKLLVQRIKFNPDFWRKYLLPRLLAFYATHCQAFLLKNPPPVTCADIPFPDLAARRTQEVGPPPPVQQPKQAVAVSTAPPLCFVCKISDIRILRTCRQCKRSYHHSCQNKDEEGKLCDDCLV